MIDSSEHPVLTTQLPTLLRALSPPSLPKHRPHQNSQRLLLQFPHLSTDCKFPDVCDGFLFFERALWQVRTCLRALYFRVLVLVVIDPVRERQPRSLCLALHFCRIRQSARESKRARIHPISHAFEDCGLDIDVEPILGQRQVLHKLFVIGRVQTKQVGMDVEDLPRIILPALAVVSYDVDDGVVNIANVMFLGLADSFRVVASSYLSGKLVMHTNAETPLGQHIPPSAREMTLKDLPLAAFRHA